LETLSCDTINDVIASIVEGQVQKNCSCIPTVNGYGECCICV